MRIRFENIRYLELLNVYKIEIEKPESNRGLKFTSKNNIKMDRVEI